MNDVQAKQSILHQRRRASKELSLHPQDSEMRGALASGEPADPQWTTRCVKIAASPDAQGSARMC